MRRTADRGQARRLRIIAAIASTGAAVAIAGLASGELKQKSVSFTPDPLGQGTAKCAPGQQALAGGFFAPFRGFAPDEAASLVFDSKRKDERRWRFRATSLGVPAAVDAFVYCDRLGYGLEPRGDSGLGPISSAKAQCHSFEAAVAGGFDLPDRGAAPLVSRRYGNSSWVVRAAVPPGEPPSEPVDARAYCDPLDPHLSEREQTRVVPAGQTSSVTARCRGNEELRSGGFSIESSESEGNAGFVHGSRRSGKRGWAAFGFAAQGTPELTAYAYCRREARPKVIELEYSEGGGSNLYAFPCRNPDTLSFATNYGGRRASTAAELTDISDSDIDRDCSEVWRPSRENVFRLVRESLHQRGVAIVRTRARRGSRLDAHRWRIVLAECSLGPLPYCELTRSGKHIQRRG